MTSKTRWFPGTTGMVTSKTMRLWALGVMLGLASAGSAQKITSFDPPGSTYTQAKAINSKGQIAGFYFDAAKGKYRGFVRDEDGITPFDAASSISTQALSINSKGQITGSYVDTSFNFRGFVRDEEGFTSFDASGSNFTQAQSINSAGQIAGYYFDSTRGLYRGFVRDENGSITTFDPPGSVLNILNVAINSEGRITGSYTALCSQVCYLIDRGFLRQPDRTIAAFDAPDPYSSGTYAEAINPECQIVGSYSTLLGGVLAANRAFLRRADGTFTAFDAPGSFNSTFAQAVNSNGQIAGNYYGLLGSAVGVHGFLRGKDGTYTAFDPPGSSQTYPQAISSEGRIAGYYVDASFVTHGFVRQQQ